MTDPKRSRAMLWKLFTFVLAPLFGVSMLLRGYHEIGEGHRRAVAMGVLMLIAGLPALVIPAIELYWMLRKKKPLSERQDAP